MSYKTIPLSYEIFRDDPNDIKNNTFRVKYKIINKDSLEDTQKEGFAIMTDIQSDLNKNTLFTLHELAKMIGLKYSCVKKADLVAALQNFFESANYIKIKI
jgi:hypothetical protein